MASRSLALASFLAVAGAAHLHAQVTITSLGTGTAALLGGDLTDPENDGQDVAGAENDLAANGWNFAEAIPNEKPGFEGGEATFNIFDNKLGPSNDKWCCNARNITIVFDSPVSLSHFTLSSANDTPNRDWQVWRLLGSADGATFDVIYEDPGDTRLWAQRLEVLRFDLEEATPPYTHFRFEADSNWGDGLWQVGEVELFGQVDLTDTDGDGMPDFYEETNGLDPNDDGTLDPAKGPAGDLDGDGVSNLREFRARTDPNNADTDADGFDDNYELNSGTDPNNAGSVPPLGLEIVGLPSATELSLRASPIPPGQLYHLRTSTDLDGFLPLDPPVDFDSDTVFPITVPVDAAVASASFFQIWQGASPSVLTLPVIEDFEAGGGSYTTMTHNPGNAVGAGGPWMLGPSQRGGGQVWTADGAEGNNSPFEQWLTSPPMLVPQDGAVTLEFDHFHNFETNWDGGVIMISVNGGPFTYLPGTAFTENGYNDVVQVTDDWGYPDDMNGLEMFSNVSFGFIHSAADLGDFLAGDTLQIRFRAGWDWFVLNSSPNWEIDAVEVTLAP